MRVLKKELKRIEESEHEPKDKEYVRNLLLAPCIGTYKEEGH